jgi:DNA-binding PadR family transcriptional regulator
VAEYVERRGDYPSAAQLGLRSDLLVTLRRRGLLDRGGWRYPVYALTPDGREALRRWEAP